MSEWSNKDLEFLKENYVKYSKKELSVMLNKTPNAVQLKANRLGLKKDKKYYYNKNYFNNITEPNQAYWLGFIYADGYVTQSGNHYCVGIELSEKDKNHLKKFNRCLDGNLQVYTEKSGCSHILGREIKPVDISVIRVFCKEMMNDLIGHGCCKNKSLIKKEPIGVPDELMRHFIRGYFDGNGSICSSYNKNVDKSYLRVSIETGSIDFVNWLSEYLNNVGFENGFYKDAENSYKIQISHKTNKDFLRYLYDNAEMYLDRKYNKYKIAVYGESAMCNHK